MAYMSSFQMKSPPSDGEILDDWEQMADSGVSRIFLEVFCYHHIHNTKLSLHNLASR